MNDRPHSISSTWESRELPLLAAVARAEQTGTPADTHSLANDTRLTTRDASMGLRALYDAEYLTGIDATTMSGPSFDLLDVRLLERGRRAVGQWPADDLRQVLLAILEQRISSTADPEERSRLERFREGVIGVGTEVVTSLLSSFLRHAAGLP